MKRVYYLSVPQDIRPCVADVMFWREVSELDLENVYIIHRINVPQNARGNGYGTELLKMILSDAEEEGVTLMLAPESSGGLSQNDLIAWYLRHGFTFTRSLAMMEWTPKGGDHAEEDQGTAPDPSRK